MLLDDAVLPDREHLDVVLAQQAEALDHLLVGLTEADHQADLVVTSSPPMALAFASTRAERRKTSRRASGYSRGTTSTL